MRLLTHNYLQSNVKGTPNGYPLSIEASKITIDDEKSPNVDITLVQNLLPKLRYDALVQAVQQVHDQLELLQQQQQQQQDDDDNDETNSFVVPPPPPLLPDTLPPSLAAFVIQPPSPPPSTTNNGEEKEEGQSPPLTTTTTTDDATTTPATQQQQQEEDKLVVLQQLHHVLFNIHIEEGNLICPDTGRKFPIKQGIPNMILHEDEV